MAITARPRPYYSARATGDPSIAQLSIESFSRLFLSAYQQLCSKGYFDEAFGFCCVDLGEVPGTVGPDVENYVLLLIRKNLWPINDRVYKYSEEDLFDLVEFLHDHVSKPTDGSLHSFADCGMHWEKFDQEEGRAEFREMLNPLLAAYSYGFEINAHGEILGMAGPGMQKLMHSSPPGREASVHDRMNLAINRFQRYNSSLDERRNAVRDLADVLEKLRPQAKEVLNSKDEADLFNLANNFGIRHFNEKQKTDYDQAVWLSWMFYFYLATINACLHLLERKAKKSK